MKTIKISFLVMIVFFLNTTTAQIPSAADTSIIADLDFKNTEIKDVVRALANKYRLNIFIDDAVNSRITIHLNQISCQQAITFIAEQNGLRYSFKDNIYRLHVPEPAPVTQPLPLQIIYKNNLLNLDLKNEPLDRVVRELSSQTGMHIILANGVNGNVSGFLQNINSEKGLKTLMSANGLQVWQKDDIFWINWGYQPAMTDSRDNKRYWIHQSDSLVNMDVSDAEIRDVLQEMARQMGVDLVIYGEVNGRITARCSAIPFEEALNMLFRNTNYCFRREGAIYMVGDKSQAGMTSARLLRLRYLKADELAQKLPKQISNGASVQIIKEHNALMVIGPQDVIQEAADFVAQIDQPIPQVLIEALVIDFSNTDISEFKLEAGIGQLDSSANLSSIFPSIETTAHGDYINGQIALYGPKWGLANVGKLPSNFYLRLKAMEQQGKAKIRSRPQIATLNGRTASISIGSTQYFILKTQTPYQSSNQLYVQESQRFETIKAEMLLKITPWVSASGEITTEIHPEFSTPKGSLDPNRPPTIDHRILDSTVRLRDGETIILGGLIQEAETNDDQSFPLLSRIPLLGSLFKSHNHNTTTSELMIYVTPHLSFSASLSELEKKL